MNYETCRIGQLSRCNNTGCEWKKVFGGYCWLRPTQSEVKFKQKRTVQEHINKRPLELNKEVPNEFKTPIQDEWIKKIKVKL